MLKVQRAGFRAGALALLAGFVAVTAKAATPADWDGCERGYPPEKKIAACTKISNNPSETTPDRIKALIQRAFAHKFKNEYDAANADFGAAIDLDPNRASTYETRAFMFAGEGEIDRPIADHTAAINFEANGYRYLQRGDLYRKKGDRQHAVADYKLAVAHIPLRWRRIRNLPGRITVAAVPIAASAMSIMLLAISMNSSVEKTTPS
jgi:tetratricopeptide (TPR) repeat protein